jgi:hypothetical protein
VYLELAASQRRISDEVVGRPVGDLRDYQIAGAREASGESFSSIGCGKFGESRGQRNVN